MAWYKKHESWHNALWYVKILEYLRLLGIASASWRVKRVKATYISMQWMCTPKLRAARSKRHAIKISRAHTTCTDLNMTHCWWRSVTAVPLLKSAPPVDRIQSGWWQALGFSASPIASTKLSVDGNHICVCRSVFVSLREATTKKGVWTLCTTGSALQPLLLWICICFSLSNNEITSLVSHINEAVETTTDYCM